LKQRGFADGGVANNDYFKGILFLSRISLHDDIAIAEAFERITTLASEQIKEEEIYIPSTIN